MYSVNATVNQERKPVYVISYRARLDVNFTVKLLICIDPASLMWKMRASSVLFD